MSYIDMNQPWIYMYSPSRSPLPPPSLPNPSETSQCIRPEHLSHASNDFWVNGLWANYCTLPFIMCCCSVAHLCLTHCDPVDCSMPDFSVLHHHIYDVSELHPIIWKLEQNKRLISPKQERILSAVLGLLLKHCLFLGLQYAGYTADLEFVSFYNHMNLCMHSHIYIHTHTHLHLYILLILFLQRILTNTGGS